MVLENTLESPLDCKEIKPVYPKGSPECSLGRTDAEAEAPTLWPSFMGRTDIEAETPILWPPDSKS